MEVDLGHCLCGLGEVRPYSFMEVDLGHCVGGFRWFLGNLAIFLYGVDLGHCVGGFRWFLGS
jgi:23S rRNA C2498 (ribose-2'-O)-methylase RlmM